MYYCKHFKLYELVWRSLWKQVERGEIPEWVIWRKFDERILITADQIRDHVKEEYDSAVYINNYHWNGWLQYSGARPQNCDEGAEFSTHKDFNTLDLHVWDWQDLLLDIKIKYYKELWNYIYGHQEQFMHITVMEDINLTHTWIHVSTCNFGLDNGNIKVIKE